jgi:hypothetical protein
MSHKESGIIEFLMNKLSIVIIGIVALALLIVALIIISL